MRFIKTVSTLVFALLAAAGSAQELTLFEQIEADPQAQQPAQAMPMQQQNGEPAFTLRGTSRFGDEYTTTLINRNGEAIKVKWHAGENIAVPGFDGFNVVAIGSRSVSLVQPAFDACIASEEKGVSCTGDNVAVLGMATSTPLAANGTPPNFAPGQNQQTFGNENGAAPGGASFVDNAPGQQVFINPFSGEAQVANQPSPEEQAARAERQRQRAERLNQFEAVRIDPADVPPGMRLVRTPFGDRVVPVRE